MEEIITKLLIPDSNAVREGTKELKEAFKKPEAIPALCDVVVSAQRADIRQTAAVVLRRRLVKRHNWNKVPPEIRTRIKQGMLEVVVKEEVQLVKNAIAQLIGTLGKHEFPNNTWPEILQFIHTLCGSKELHDKELGMYCLSIMTEIAQDSYIVHLSVLTQIFSATLNLLPSPDCDLAFYTIISMKNLVSVSAGHQEMNNLFFNSLPRILEIISASLNQNGKKVCDMLEILEELIEYCAPTVIPHINMIVEVCLRIGSNTELNAEVRIKAIGVLGWLIRSKSKVLQSKKLIEPIIDAMMQVMSQKPSAEDGDDVSQVEDYYQGDPDEYTPTTIATQTLDMIALHVPPEKCIPTFLGRIEPALQGNDVHCQKAAYLALAVLTEGCADYIRKKQLESFLNCVYVGINSSCLPVRNAALFALGQFAEHLQPEISQYASNLLPILFEQLIQTSRLQSNKPLPSSLDRIFYALETFCENLGEDLIPHLPSLMEILFTSIDPNHWSMQLKKLGFDAVSAAASAVKEGLLPYFPKILEMINVYVNSESSSENYQILCDALDCLAALAQTIGIENFRPLAQETLQLGLRILHNSSDPDNRRAAFALVGALTMVLKDDFAPVLPNVVQQLLDTIQSSEGIQTQQDNELKDDADVYDDSTGSDNDIEESIELDSTSSDDSEQCRYMVENSYVEEKEQACITLKEICSNVGPKFLPFLEKSFQEVFKLLNFPQDDMRKAALDALQQFCITLNELNTSEGKQGLYSALQLFIPKCAEIIRLDEERQVVMCALDAYSTLLEKLKGDVLVGEGHREAIMNSVIDVFNLKVACQEHFTEHEEDADDDADAEQDELLIEYAFDVIPHFSKAIPSDDFVLYFPNILTLAGNRTRKRKSESQRSCAYGTLAECMKSLNGYIQKFLDQLTQLWFAGIKDASDEVRNNAVYGLGEMVLYGKDCVFPHYPQIMQILSATVAKETHTGTIDNICGALAKLIIANSSIVPLDQVLPAFLQRLPLKEDFQENEAVINCLFNLYQQGNPILRQHMSTVIKIVAHIYGNNQIHSDGLKPVVTDFLKSMNRDFHHEFTASVSSLGPTVAESLQKVLT